MDQCCNDCIRYVFSFFGFEMPRLAAVCRHWHRLIYDPKWRPKLSHEELALNTYQLWMPFAVSLKLYQEGSVVSDVWLHRHRVHSSSLWEMHPLTLRGIFFHPSITQSPMRDASKMQRLTRFISNCSQATEDGFNAVFRWTAIHGTPDALRVLDNTRSIESFYPTGMLQHDFRKAFGEITEAENAEIYLDAVRCRAGNLGFDEAYPDIITDAWKCLLKVALQRKNHIAVEAVLARLPVKLDTLTLSQAETVRECEYYIDHKIPYNPQELAELVVKRTPQAECSFRVVFDKFVHAGVKMDWQTAYSRAYERKLWSLASTISRRYLRR